MLSLDLQSMEVCSLQVVKVIIALTDLTRQIVSSKTCMNETIMLARDYRTMNYNIVVLTVFSYNYILPPGRGLSTRRFNQDRCMFMINLLPIDR